MKFTFLTDMHSKCLSLDFMQIKNTADLSISIFIKLCIKPNVVTGSFKNKQNKNKFPFIQMENLINEKNKLTKFTVQY